MSACECHNDAEELSQQRGLLLTLLGLNFTMFLFESGSGWWVDSAGLLADGLDMLADAAVYALALYAVGRGARSKAGAALASGFAQLCLALLLIWHIYQRWRYGTEPLGEWMIAIAALALAVNLVCLWLLRRHRRGEVHMRASWLFSANDVLVNLGVMVAGGMVSWSASPWPDLLIGSVIVLLVMRTGARIVVDAQRELRGETKRGLA
ncbi:cation transporter [Motiliproteus sediminis]|uniref:cation transporter n=1 Tax=Motiliproteus sediminis TaxID=1468178 RepID=UPI001AEF3E58|nr:cation transporter [Motiliproteus sediminis]